MCYICKCFGWILDLIQRVLTFILACIMCCAICILILIAVAAGIAYGYNYSLAEFLTLTRSDVSVYVRRGQFYEKPDFASRRRKGDDTDLFSSNISDYQDTNLRSDSKPLSDTWRKALDTRTYAEKLTKYSQRAGENFSNFNNILGAVDGSVVSPPTTQDRFTVIPLTRVYSVTPNSIMMTTIIPQQEGQPDIVMRNYEPVARMTISPPEFDPSSDEFYNEADRPTSEIKAINKSKDKGKNPDAKLSFKELPKNHYVVPMRHFGETKSPQADYHADDADEEKVVYKPT